MNRYGMRRDHIGYFQPTWVTRLRCRLVGHFPHPYWADLCGLCGKVNHSEGRWL